jgi:hypothetical protein
VNNCEYSDYGYDSFVSYNNYDYTGVDSYYNNYNYDSYNNNNNNYYDYYSYSDSYYNQHNDDINWDCQNRCDNAFWTYVSEICNTIYEYDEYRTEIDPECIKEKLPHQFECLSNQGCFEEGREWCDSWMCDAVSQCQWWTKCYEGGNTQFYHDCQKSCQPENSDNSGECVYQFCEAEWNNCGIESETAKNCANAIYKFVDHCDTNYAGQPTEECAINEWHIVENECGDDQICVQDAEALKACYFEHCSETATTTQTHSKNKLKKHKRLSKLVKQKKEQKRASSKKAHLKREKMRKKSMMQHKIKHKQAKKKLTKRKMRKSNTKYF